MEVHAVASGRSSGRMREQVMMPLCPSGGSTASRERLAAQLSAPVPPGNADFGRDHGQVLAGRELVGLRTHYLLRTIVIVCTHIPRVA